MEVGVRELRNRLSRWLEEVKGGGEILITERGKPVARLIGVGGVAAIDKLIDEGLVSRAETRSASAPRHHRIKPTGDISGLVKNQRR